MTVSKRYASLDFQKLHPALLRFDIALQLMEAFAALALRALNNATEAVTTRDYEYAFRLNPQTGSEVLL
ncbi:hypothetical protein E4U58_007184 [Claviceps cyperi]|nr:hypothetical protein E4U58_007184 [Claviceps cyperi]